MCIGGGAHMENPVGINTCTDACTHSLQGVGTEMRWLQYKHTATLVSLLLSKGVWGDIGSQMDMYTCTNAYTHFNKIV